jgi:hypothetical protein
MKYKNHFGFTLMEMLLVTIFTSVIGIAVFQSFNNGLKLWARGQNLGHEADVMILLDKIGEDLRSSLPITGISFKGSSVRFSFPAIVLTPADKKSMRIQEGVIDQIGAVEYYFEPAEGKMFRRQANYGQALKGKWTSSQEVAARLDEVSLRYYFLDEKGPLIKMETQGKFPTGVILEAHIQGEPPDRRLKRFLAIPAGG